MKCDLGRVYGAKRFKRACKGLGRLRLAVALLSAVQLPAQSSPDVEVQHLVAGLEKELNNLDFAAFREYWVQDPVVFLQSLQQNPTGGRIEGAAAFDASWHHQFDLIREAAAKRGVINAPFQNLVPNDLRIDFPAPTVAVVTFHQPGGNGLGRRMLVVARTDSGWKITHAHLSNITLSAN